MKNNRLSPHLLDKTKNYIVKRPESFIVISLLSFFAVMTIVIVLLSMTSDLRLRKKYYYEKGDYSTYQCEYNYGCEEASTWKVCVNKRFSYYCDEHAESQKSYIDAFLGVSPDGKRSAFCPSCGRRFSNSKTNSKSISETGMCSNCYRNFKDMSNALGR